MHSPYLVNNRILHLISSISEKIGAINAVHLDKPKAELRKKNRIKTIQSSLGIEGNTLTIEQVSTLLENKKVLGPQKDILEVKNAIATYDKIRSFEFSRLSSLMKAHALLMNKLVDHPGKLRTKNVGIMKGQKLAHLAPPGSRVKPLMKDLFSYLKKDGDNILIKSCVFHYEFEFIHPFTDGNGRMGRLWQTVILMQHYPLFEFLPIESIIRKKQKKYYAVLSVSDKSGHSTPFIEFMLKVIDESLENLLQTQEVTLSIEDRISHIPEIFGKNDFTRKDYLQHFKHISTATASRDLQVAVKKGVLRTKGDKRTAVYRLTKGGR